jgi:hypothetical protein
MFDYQIRDRTKFCRECYGRAKLAVTAAKGCRSRPHKSLNLRCNYLRVPQSNAIVRIKTPQLRYRYIAAGAAN